MWMSQSLTLTNVSLNFIWHNDYLEEKLNLSLISKLFNDTVSAV